MTARINTARAPGDERLTSKWETHVSRKSQKQLNKHYPPLSGPNEKNKPVKKQSVKLIFVRPSQRKRLRGGHANNNEKPLSKHLGGGRAGEHGRGAHRAEKTASMANWWAAPAALAAPAAGPAPAGAETVVGRSKGRQNDNHVNAKTTNEAADGVQGRDVFPADSKPDGQTTQAADGVHVRVAVPVDSKPAGQTTQAAEGVHVRDVFPVDSKLDGQTTQAAEGVHVRITVPVDSKLDGQTTQAAEVVDVRDAVPVDGKLDGEATQAHAAEGVDVRDAALREKKLKLKAKRKERKRAKRRKSVPKASVEGSLGRNGKEPALGAQPKGQLAALLNMPSTELWRQALALAMVLVLIWQPTVAAAPAIGVAWACLCNVSAAAVVFVPYYSKTRCEPVTWRTHAQVRERKLAKALYSPVLRPVGRSRRKVAATPLALRCGGRGWAQLIVWSTLSFACIMGAAGAVVGGAGGAVSVHGLAVPGGAPPIMSPVAEAVAQEQDTTQALIGRFSGGIVGADVCQ
eukprot:g4312.t1